MASSQRYAFLDVLRGIAVLWMIQVHVTNVFLDSALRSGRFFTALNISNGFVAPAFIFCAGAGLWIALSRKGQDYLTWSPAFWKYLRRLAYILMWAYVLHMPAWSFTEMLSMHGSELLTGLQIDVLQTIVYSSLMVVTVFFITRTLSRTTWVLAATSVLLWATTAVFWRSDPYSYLPDALAVMVTTQGSPFPLTPWSAYLFAGFFITQWFMQIDHKERIAMWFVVGGAAIPFVIFMIKGLGLDTPWSGMWWSASPGSQLFRICGILLTWGVLYHLESWLTSSKTGRFMQEVGQESLFLYLSHLLIVYGQLPLALDALGIPSGGYLSVVLIWVGVTIPLLFVMKWWHRFKKDQPNRARWVLAVQVGWLIGSLVFTPPGFQWGDLLS